jgi:hypothetical protein
VKESWLVKRSRRAPIPIPPSLPYAYAVQAGLGPLQNPVPPALRHPGPADRTGPRRQRAALPNQLSRPVQDCEEIPPLAAVRNVKARASERVPPKSSVTSHSSGPNVTFGVGAAARSSSWSGWPRWCPRCRPSSVTSRGSGPAGCGGGARWRHPRAACGQTTARCGRVDLGIRRNSPLRRDEPRARVGHGDCGRAAAGGRFEHGVDSWRGGCVGRGVGRAGLLSSLTALSNPT